MALPEQSDSARDALRWINDIDSEEVDMETLTPEQEDQFREELDVIKDKLTELEALTSFLVGLRIGRKQRPHVAKIVKAAANARAFLPNSGRAINAYDAERATAFATTAIAEAVALVLERALASPSDEP